MSRRDADPEIQAGTKLLLTCLSHPELLMVRAWVDEAVHRQQRPHLRLVRTPSWSEPDDFDGSDWELAGRLRHRLHLLPEDRLIELSMWIQRRLHQRQRA